jgi:hypothetical protein
VCINWDGEKISGYVNDQAHIEQKNWTAMRRLVRYDRYKSEAAVGLIEAV